MYLDGIAISCYRSFGPDLELIAPMGKINFLIGQNNSGKSNVARFLMEQYSQVAEAAAAGTTIRYKGLDVHQGKDCHTLRIGFGIRPERIMNDPTRIFARGQQSEAVTRFLSMVVSSESLRRETELAWLVYEATDQDPSLVVEKLTIEALKKEGVLNYAQWRTLWGAIGGQPSNEVDICVAGTLRRLGVTQLAAKIPFQIVPAIRSVGKAGSTGESLDGTGIIDRLARLQNPGPEEREKQQRFEEINAFVREVTGNSTADIEIPYERNMILVKMDQKELPLESLGTGIHEVVILAAAATTVNESVLCLEEPEIHQHPLLQRKLVNYLAEKTSNQYVITTHSAHLLDVPGAAVFHFRHNGSCTSVSLARSPSERSDVCVDLGYRASDILQTNCVIWVEGPSDRLYVRRWIEELAPELREGIHYSIMFYGGRLLSHLSFDDQEVEEFISLKRLNRFMVMVIDSDKEGSYTRINATKKRILTECGGERGIVWVTKGRTIENYLPGDVLQKALKKVHPSASKLVGTGQYDDCTKYRPKKGGRGIKTADKVKLARAVVAQDQVMDILDLKRQIGKIIGFIKEANGQATP